MPRHDVIVIGDSLSAVHLTLEMARDDVAVLLVKPDMFPVEVMETERGAFDCDLASGCDFSYYSHTTKQTSFNVKRYTVPYRLYEPGFTLREPANDADLHLELSKKFQAYTSELMFFFSRIRYIHEIINEIETKTGFGYGISDSRWHALFAQIPPWLYVRARKLATINFTDFLSAFNIPCELLRLYEVMVNDQYSLGTDSIDALSGVELITRRYHGLSYPDGGWSSLRDSLLTELRGRDSVKIIGGKKIDMFRSSAGLSYEVCVDERDVHSADWLVIDETLGLIAESSSDFGHERYAPIGCHSRSHADIRLFLGFETELTGECPCGVNYFYRDCRFPPHAPHLIRVDVMPLDESDQHNLKTRLTVRARYPWEALVSSWGEKVEHDYIQNELLSLVRRVFPQLDSEPNFIKMTCPPSCWDPQCGLNPYVKAMQPFEFASVHRNIKLIPFSGINDGNIRLAFRESERIASEIRKRVTLRKKLVDMVSKPIAKSSGFKYITSAGGQEEL